MNKKALNASSIAYAIWIFIHLFVFVGLLFEGVYLLINGIFISDKISGLIFIAIGFIFSLIALQSLQTNYLLTASEWIRNKISPNKWQLIISIIILIILVTGRFASILLYAGHAAGKLVLAQVYQGYFHTFSINIRSLPLDFIPWIGQWYYVYMVVGWGIAISNKLKGYVQKSS